MDLQLGSHAVATAAITAIMRNITLKQKLVVQLGLWQQCQEFCIECYTECLSLNVSNLKYTRVYPKVRKERSPRRRRRINVEL
jgi:hypothetical protein